MNIKDYNHLMNNIIKEIKSTRDAGQKEYARDEDDVLANFNRISKLTDTSKEKVLMTYVYKHIDGIMAYINGHTSQREDVRGRIKDIMVYMTLLWAMVEDSEDTFLDRLEKEALMLDKMGFTQSKTVFNPKTGEVSYPDYQDTGDEVI
tara:strand:- start:816 stop:1259 length:444 start_codon:yes stop_codon:yes gene_type:complete